MKFQQWVDAQGVKRCNFWPHTKNKPRKGYMIFKKETVSDTENKLYVIALEGSEKQIEAMISSAMKI